MYRMMYIGLLSVVLLSACFNRQQQEQDSPQQDTVSVDTGALPGDTSLSEVSGQILRLIKTENYDSLVLYFHPEKGVRFSPYAFIDTTEHLRFSSSEFTSALATGEVLHWGAFDGSNAPIDMDIPTYFKRFVYDADFLHAEETNLNRSVAKGNSLHNMLQVFPEASYTESYFSGFEEKYDGMDWRALSLVFEQVEGHYRLIAVVHDAWTI